MKPQVTVPTIGPNQGLYVNEDNQLDVSISDLVRAGSGITTTTLYDQLVNNQLQVKSQGEGLVLFFDALGSKADSTFYYSETNNRLDVRNYIYLK